MKRIIGVQLMGIIIIALTACSGYKNIVKEDLIEHYYDLEQIEGETIEIHIGASQVIKTTSNIEIIFNMYHERKRIPVVAVLEKDPDWEIIEDEYYKLIGMVGVYDGEHGLNVDTDRVPMIRIYSIEPSTFVDTMTPTLKEIIPQNAIINQKELTIKIDKIEIAEHHTRVYYTLKKESTKSANISLPESKIIQNNRLFNYRGAGHYRSDFGEYKSQTYFNPYVRFIRCVLIFDPIDLYGDFNLFINTQLEDDSIDEIFLFSIKN